MEENDKARERRLRIETELQGFLLLKSKTAKDNRVGYRIVDAMTNRVEAGAKYDLSLDDVWKFLNA